jgi:hypothetical protein
MSIKNSRENLKSIYVSREERHQYRDYINNRPDIANLLKKVGSLQEKLRQERASRNPQKYSKIYSHANDILDHTMELMGAYQELSLYYLAQEGKRHACMAVIEKMKMFTLYREVYQEIEGYLRWDLQGSYTLPAFNKKAMKQELYSACDSILASTKLLIPERRRILGFFPATRAYAFPLEYPQHERLSSLRNLQASEPPPYPALTQAGLPSARWIESRPRPPLYGSPEFNSGSVVQSGLFGGNSSGADAGNGAEAGTELIR